MNICDDSFAKGKLTELITIFYHPFNIETLIIELNSSYIHQ
jgi:hypothetical protein